MTRPVHVVAVSACTPVGTCAETAAAAMRARISRLALHPQLCDANGEAVCVARDSRLSPQLTAAPRVFNLAATALCELLDKLSAHAPLPAAYQVELALAEPRPGFDQPERDSVIAELAKLSGIQVRAEATGHAGTLAAITRAAKSIEQGSAELCVIGGADSYLDHATLSWLEQERRLARPGRSGGMPPGEAASFIALASDELRRTLKLPSLALVRGAALAHETRSWDSPEGLLGEGLSQAVLQACAELRLPEERIDMCFGDLNGERLRADDWVYASLRVAQLFRDAGAVTSTVAECGDLGAAGGTLACALAIAGFRRGYASGPRVLVWGASWGGLRAACVLEATGDTYA